MQTFFSTVCNSQEFKHFFMSLKVENKKKWFSLILHITYGQKKVSETIFFLLHWKSWITNCSFRSTKKNWKLILFLRPFCLANSKKNEINFSSQVMKNYMIIKFFLINEECHQMVINALCFHLSIFFFLFFIIVQNNS